MQTDRRRDIRRDTQTTRCDSPAVRAALELILFVHINLAHDAEDELASLGFHRTHHRILYLVARHPGITVGDLLSILRLTPQAVQTPMKQLYAKGFLQQRHAASDRRRRCLFLTGLGDTLLRRLSHHQHKRISQAFQATGPGAAKGFLKVLEMMLSDEDKAFLKVLDRTLDLDRRETKANGTSVA